MSDRYILVVKKDFKGKIVARRKDFMDLFLKVLGDNLEAKEELSDKFGVRFVDKYDSGNKVTILNDGEAVFRE